MEDSDDDNKLISHEHVASPMNVVVLIAVKSMLKLLKNYDLQLSLGTAHGVA